MCKEPREVYTQQPVKNCKLPTAPRVSLEAPSPGKPSDDTLIAAALFIRDPELDDLAKSRLDSCPTKDCEIMHMCCFKPLHTGAVCNAAIDNRSNMARSEP